MMLVTSTSLSTPLTYCLISVLRRNFHVKIKRISKAIQNDVAYRGVTNYSLVQCGTVSPKRCIHSTVHPLSVGLSGPRFIYSEELAASVREMIWPGDSLKDENAIIIDSNPGPGFMSQELLNSGAKKLIIMHGNDRRKFKVGNLQIPPEIECRVLKKDFFKIYFRSFNDGKHQTQGIHFEDLLQDIKPVKWEDDVPIKVFGCLSKARDRTILYVMASLLLERMSVYSYGRMQLNFFTNRLTHTVLFKKPGEKGKLQYTGLTVLLQFAADIKLLGTVPESLFTANPEAFINLWQKKNAGKEEPHLYLMQITPKRNLFQEYPMSRQEMFVFIYFVRQLMSYRKKTILDVVQNWAPGQNSVIQELGFKEDTTIGLMNGIDFYRLFNALAQTDTFNGYWMGHSAENYAMTQLR